MPLAALKCTAPVPWRRLWVDPLPAGVQNRAVVLLVDAEAFKPAVTEDFKRCPNEFTGRLIRAL